jgi:Tfp pilus assembly protein PilE
MERRGERGTTLIEVMVAGVILLVALLGFAGMASTSAASTGVAHRRGAAAYMNTGLLDRYLVSTRTIYAQVPANTWIIDTCYDVDGQVIVSNSVAPPPAPPPSTTFTCPTAPTPTFYRTWLSLSGTGPWALSVYAERIDPGCTDPADATRAKRYASLACVAADLFLTD